MVLVIKKNVGFPFQNGVRSVYGCNIISSCRHHELVNKRSGLINITLITQSMIVYCSISYLFLLDII